MSDMLELNEWLADVLRTLVEEGHATVRDPATGQMMSLYDCGEVCRRGGTVQISLNADPATIAYMRGQWNMWSWGCYTTNEFLTILKQYWRTLENMDPAWTDEFLDALHMALKPNSNAALTRIYQLLAAPKMQRK